MFIQHVVSHKNDSRESTERMLLQRTRSLSRTLCMLAASLLALALPGVARAQGNCEPQWHSYGPVPGTNSVVDASIMWDPDGAGQQPAQLVIGGSFTTAGGVSANRIARWNGNSWSALGSGLNGQVFTLTTLPNGNLIAGGSFTIAGGVIANRIAEWNGTEWSALGSGMNDTVAALTVLANGNLIAGGRFGRAGGIIVNRVARWNGIEWSALGTGMSGGNPGSVGVLTTLPNGDLIAGGGFTTAGGVTVNCIARWNGSAWSAMGSGMRHSLGISPTVSALIRLPNGDLIAGGTFLTAGGGPANSVARWNGSAWSAMGSGMSGGSVTAFAVLPNGTLVAGGGFTTAGGVAANRVASWNGAAWSAMGSGMSGGSVGLLNTLTNLPNGDLIAGGYFTIADGVTVNYLARWNGIGWSAWGLGLNREVFALSALPQGDLIAGGQFMTVGAIAANHIARQVGDAWQPLGVGMGNLGPSAVVSALVTMPNGDLIAGGRFATAGGITVNNIARWNGTTWAALGSGLTGPLPHVTALSILPNGDLIAGGSFTTAGNVPANNIARWTGTSWSAIGSGVNGAVNALSTLPNGDLIAGGSFTAAGSTPANRVARWNGISWSALGAGLGVGNSGAVLALISLRSGELIAGGDFTTAGGISANRIARWDGTAWSAIGSGVGGQVFALATLLNGDLIAGGRFETAGGISANHIARWTGTAWSALGTGLNSSVRALAVLSNGDLICGGDFTTAGQIPSGYIARWGFGTSCTTCDSLDFNGDSLFPDDADLVEFLTVLAGNECSTGTCNDIDFNNDGLFPDDTDLVAFLTVLAGGDC